MDLESSDTDVSVGGGDEYRFASPLTAAVPLQPPPSKHARNRPMPFKPVLMNCSASKNIKKYGLLKAKRARKDEKICRKREIQEVGCHHRGSSTSRCQNRRSSQTGRCCVFSSLSVPSTSPIAPTYTQQNLRRRLKRLKRRLPLEESPKPGHRSTLKNW